ncbi:hypothetical protein LOD99_775 [Oopsacas minuta]|uniref:Uncharacterized protein n=1 Tax=Oopsacas minuta TaxID=111878 RepID=A0AAV7JZD4_9METZ|nr:hypothetical protein LOD99_775 [Oopsacas minuta]
MVQERYTEVSAILQYLHNPSARLVKKTVVNTFCADLLSRTRRKGIEDEEHVSEEVSMVPYSPNTAESISDLDDISLAKRLQLAIDASMKKPEDIQVQHSLFNILKYELTIGEQTGKRGYHLEKPRTAVSPSVTKLSVLDRLNERGIILSVVTEAHEIYHSAGGSISYTYAAIKISNTFIGFADGNYYTDIIDAISPVFLNTLDSNAEENYVDLAWETGGIAFDLHFFDNSLYDTRSSAVFNKLMFSWGGRANSSSSTTYAPVLVSAINSTLISSHTGDLIFSFICISTSTSDSNVSLLVDGDWYTNLNSGNIEQSVVFEYPFPHPGSYDFLCVANNSIGGDQTLGVYTVPDALRIYPQYSQFTYIPDSHIECGTTSLQESQCVDLVVVIDINAYTDATIDRIISFTASLPANSTTCLNRYGLTLYGTSTLSQIISLTNSPTQSYFSTPSDLSSAIQTQRNIGTSLGSGSRDGYEAIDKIVKLYSFRSDVQKKIIFFSNEVREVAPTFSNLTFQSTIQTLLANRITLSTVSNADNFYYFYNNTDNRLIGMYYNTRTGIGNFSSSCDPTLDNIVSIPSVEYSITREGEHKDYVELAWRTDGTAFDLSYFEQSSGYCSELVDAIIQYAVVQNFPCTLNIVDYAFTSRSQFPDYFIWENILPQVTPICLDMVFLFDVSVLSSNYFTKLFNLINYLAVTPTLCDHVYTAYSYSDGYDAIEFIVNNHPFETDYIKSIIVITEFGRNSIYPQFTKSSTLDSLLSNGIILSVISSAGDFYYGTSPPVNILAAVRVSDTLIGFRSSGINNTILDAISTVNYTITDSNIDNDYVDIAWQTGGVSFDIDLITEDISPFATLMFIWGNPAPIEILSMSVTSQGTPNDPSPYQFTCTINDVPHATLTLIIDGVSYVSTDTTTITRVLSLSNLIPDIYEFLCIASNSNGGDTQRSQFTIKGPIPSPFTQFAFKSESGESCHDFEPLNCVDLIFLLDISGPINKYLNRIAELAGNLPEYSPACENRYGLLLFGIMNPTAMNLSANSLYGTPSQLKSAILGSLNIADTLSVSEDGYFSIHLAVGSYPFRNGVERRLALFANESVQPYSTYEHTISLLFQNEIKLTAFTYFGDIFYYTASTELIGMNFFSNIGFGNLSSTDTDINIVPNPYLKLDSGSSDESFVKLAFNTDGSIFNMKYMSNDTTPYSPELIAELFEFAVIHDVPCNLDDVYFNFENRTLTYSSPLYSKWMHITPQVQSNCVDMVFLVDRTITFRQFMPGVMSIANNLPENGNGCVNRYGLVTFETTAIIINVGVSTKFGTANQLYNQLISFSYSGATEDGYVGIDAIVNEFEFRDSDTIQKHIILFGDEPRRIVNSSLTDTSILQALGDNNIILTVATTADNFYQLDYTTRLHVAALISNSYIGFASNGTNQEYVDVYSPIDLYTYSSNQHDSYVALAWQSGGLAFDLDYFRDSLINMRTVVTLFNTLMFSWGSPVDLQIIPSSYEANNQLTIECSTNDVSNPSISLIVGDQLYSNTNSNSLQTTFSSWNYSTYSYICIAYNSVGGASDIATLDIEIPNGLPVNYSLTVQSSESILVEWERSVGSNIVLISYRVVYQGILFDTMQYTATTTDTDVILENLSPFTNYSVYIIANTPSNSSQTDVKIATTFQYPPTESPQNITAIPVNSTTILINMYPPSVNHQNGPIRNYSISYQQGEQEVTTFIILNTMGTYPLEISSQIYVSSLLPFTNYTFTIFATNDAGSSPNVSVIEGTNPAAPSQPPQNITAYSNSATSITVAYYPPPYFYQNGIITRYLITIQGTPFDSELKEISVPVNLPVYPLSEEGRYIFTQLHAYNTYSIRVTAVNSVGAGPTSSPITATTLQSAPTESPQNVTAIPISSTSILLTCLPPSPTLQNGPIRNFTILYYSEWNSDIIETASILIDSSESYPFMLLSPIVISSLQPYTKYTFSIIAINDAGESPNVTVTTRTRIAAPTESPQNITATTINSTTILINMYPPSVNHQNGLIRNYSIFYQQGEQEITLFIILNTMGTYPLEISSQIYVSSLLPFTNYTFTIIATNDAGSSPNVYIMERTNPADSVPIITSPLSDKVLNPELSLTYIEQFICEATGYPPPTILWYSNNEPVTTGATLTLTTSNVTDGKEYVCQAENDLGSDSRIIIIAIDPTDIAINNVLDDIAIVLDNPSEFDPNQVGPITILISNILPNITDIDISEIDGVKDTLANTADILDDLFDVITDNDTAISLDDAGDIVNTAGDIINKDSELEDISINTDLSTQQINMGGIAIASDALVIALLTIEKVCHNLGLNYFKDALIQDTFVVNRTHVNIYGANIPISNQLTDETFPLNENSENNIIIPENVIRDLAGDQLSMKVVMAIVGKYGTKDSNIHETGLEQDSKIVTIVIPGRNESVSLVENATIIFNSALSNYSTDRIGTYLIGNLWSINGIQTIDTAISTTSLVVDHFTSFVVFATHSISPSSSLLQYYLDISSYILSAISVLCLICSLFLFIFAGKKGFFKIEINILYFNLCVALLFSTILFVLYGLKPDVIGISDLLCKIMAAIIHYSCILVFAWAFAFAIYISYKIKFGIRKNRKIYPYIIIFAWILPIVFPVVTLAIKLDVYVDVTNHCFPSLTDYVLIGLLAPVLFIAAITIVMVVILSIAFVVVRKKIENELIRNEIKHILLSTTLMTCILTIPWFTLVIFIFTESPVIEWTFVLLNDTVGIFFFIFIALRIKEVRLLLLCKSLPNANETVNRDGTRPDTFNNPIYDGNIQNLPDTMDEIYAEVAEKSGYEVMEKGAYEKEGEKSKEAARHFNPYQVDPSASPYSNQMYESDLPPIYDCIAGCQTGNQGISNPMYDTNLTTISNTIHETSTGGINNPFYESTAVEGHIECDYEELSYPNPFVSGEVPSPIHPTGTKLDKENPSDV